MRVLTFKYYFQDTFKFRVLWLTPLLSLHGIRFILRLFRVNTIIGESVVKSNSFNLKKKKLNKNDF